MYKIDHDFLPGNCVLFRDKTQYFVISQNYWFQYYVDVYTMQPTFTLSRQSQYKNLYNLQLSLRRFDHQMIAI